MTPILDWRELEKDVHYWAVDRADPTDRDIVCVRSVGDTVGMYALAYKFRENTHVFFKIEEPVLPVELEYFPDVMAVHREKLRFLMAQVCAFEGVRVTPIDGFHDGLKCVGILIERPSVSNLLTAVRLYEDHSALYPLPSTFGGDPNEHLYSVIGNVLVDYTHKTH